MEVTIFRRSATPVRCRGTVSNAHYQVTNLCTLLILNYRLRFATIWNRHWISWYLYLPEFQLKLQNTLVLISSNEVKHNWHQFQVIPQNTESQNLSVKARPHYSCSCSCDSLCSRIMWMIWQVTRQAIRAARATGSWGSACCRYIKGVPNWSSVDEDLRAQVKARRVSRRAQAWRARARAMWTGLNIHKISKQQSSCPFSLDDMPTLPTEIMHFRSTQTESFQIALGS
jgi:hypothetical protein